MTAHRALGLLAHTIMINKHSSTLLEDELGYDLQNVNKHVIDTEHALCAFYILDESWHCYTKMKRAMWEATNKCIIFPSDSDVRKLQSSK